MTGVFTVILKMVKIINAYIYMSDSEPEKTDLSRPPIPADSREKEKDKEDIDSRQIAKCMRA